MRVEIGFEKLDNYLYYGDLKKLNDQIAADHGIDVSKPYKCFTYLEDRKIVFVQ